ncbi:MAG: tetratricopeptide repeat protein [Sneathiella sp.]
MTRLLNKISFRKKAFYLIAGIAMLALAGCDSPEEKAQSHYENGKQLFKEENYVKAGLEFRNALQLNGNLADAWYHLALVEEKEGKFREYAGDLYKTIELDSQHVKAQVRIAKILLFSGRLEEAAQKSELVLRLAPESADVWSLQSAVLFRQKRNAEAVDAAEKALEIEPAHIEASLVVAVEALSKGLPGKALDVLDESLKTHPENVPLQLAKMQALEKKGDKAGIEAVFRELIKSNPDQLSYRNNLTRFYLQEGKKDEAEAEIRAIAAENPDDTDAKLNIVRFMRSVGGNDAAKAELEKMIAAEPEKYTYQFALSEILLQEGKIEEAKSLLATVIEKGGLADEGLQGRNKMSEILLRQGQKEEALKYVEEVLVQDNRNVVALMLKAAMLIDDGEVEDAITDLRSALREQPDSVKATLLLARAHEMTGAVELAEDRFDAAFKMANGKVGAALQYAQFLNRRTQHERAETVLERGLKISPNNQALLINLAQVKLIRQDWKGAEEIAVRLREINEDNVVSDQILGRSYAGQKDFDKSIQAFQKAQGRTSGGINTLVALVRLNISQGKVDEANAMLDDIIAAAPDNYPARLLKGQVLVLNGDEEGGLAEYKKVIADNPELPSAYTVLFTHQARKKDYKAAQETLDAALKALPDNYSLMMAQAGLHEIQQKYEDAISVYESILTNVPNSEVVINNIASLISTVYNDEENLRRAYSYAKRFRSSPVPHFKDTLGWIHYKLGEYELATPLLEDAVEQLPNFALLRYHLGMSYHAEQNKTRALEELTKAMELSDNKPTPDMKDLEKTLKSLKAS